MLSNDFYAEVWTSVVRSPRSKRRSGLLQQARVCLIEAEASEGQRLLLERELAPGERGRPCSATSEQTLSEEGCLATESAGRESAKRLASLGAGSDVAPAEPRPERTHSRSSENRARPVRWDGAFPAQPVVVPPRTLDRCEHTQGPRYLRGKSLLRQGEGSLDALGARPWPAADSHRLCFVRALVATSRALVQ